MTQDNTNGWTRRAFTRTGGLFALGLVTAGPAGVAVAEGAAQVAVSLEAKATPEGVTIHVFLKNLTEEPLYLAAPEGSTRVALMTSSFTAGGEALEPKAVPRKFKPVSRAVKYHHTPLPVARSITVESFEYTWTDGCRKHSGEVATFAANVRALIAKEPGLRSRGEAVGLKASATVTIPG